MEYDDEESESPEESGWDEDTVNRILQSMREEDEEVARTAADRTSSPSECESPEESGWDEETVNRILQSLRDEDEEAARIAADRPLSPPHFTPNPDSARSIASVQLPTVISSADTPSYDIEKYPLIYISSESPSPELPSLQTILPRASPTPSPPLPSIAALTPTPPSWEVARLPETTSLNPFAPVYRPRWIEMRDQKGRRQFRNAITNETTYWEQLRDTTTAFRRYAFFNYETSERLTDPPEGESYRPCIEDEIYTTLRSQPEVRRDAEAWVGKHAQLPPDTSNSRARTSTGRWQSWSVERARAREANERQGSWRDRRKQNDSDDDLYS